MVPVIDLVPFGYEGEQERFFALRLGSPQWEDWAPGQFVMLRGADWAEELPWARPLSICQVTPKNLVLFFQVTGRGTDRLSRLRPGDMVQVVGPLGTSFAMEPETSTLLLAGGVGLAPFIGYALKHPTPWSLQMIFGHRLSLDCYPFETFHSKILAESHQETRPEDREEFVRTIEKHMVVQASMNGLVLACGPEPFLRVVRELSLKHGARTQLSIETRMSCGVGACLGCVVQPLLDEATGKNRSAQEVPPQLHSSLPVPSCTCGPVFWADSIDMSKGQGRG